MDNLLTDYVVDQFKQDSGIDLKEAKMALQRVREAVEKAKIELSTVPETEINLPFIAQDSAGSKNLNIKHLQKEIF